MSCNLQVDFIGQYLWKWFPKFYEILLKCYRRHFSHHCHYRFNSYYIIGHFVISAYLSAVCFLYYLQHGNVDDSQAIEKIFVCERAERASLDNFRVPKVLFLSLFMLVLRIFCQYNDMFVGYFGMLFYYSSHGTINALNKLPAKHLQR